MDVSFRETDGRIQHCAVQLMNPTLRDVARAAVSMAFRPVGRYRLNSVLRQTAPPYRVQIGAGYHHLPGWLNTDILPSAPLYLDATKPWRVPQGQVEFIFGDQVIEHLPLGQARRLFRQAYVALMPARVLRLSTPDAESTARLYLARSSVTKSHLDRHRAHGYSDIAHDVDLLRATFAFHGHHLGYIWDFTALSSELRDAGFSSIQRARPGHSDHALLRGIEQRMARTELLTWLVVEARK